MKVGLIGESVTMHYLDYYCETHKDRIAGFSDVRDDKKYQEDDIDFVVCIASATRVCDFRNASSPGKCLNIL